MRGRLGIAFLLAAVLVGVSGAGGSAAEPSAPAYALVAPTSGRALTLVRVEPATLKPVGSGLALPAGPVFGGRSPDGRAAIFFDVRQARVKVVDLEKLKLRTSIAVAPSGWRARAAAWLTADRAAVVVQKMRGSYGQIVDQREVVVVDPLAGRVVARRALPVGTALIGSAAGGDKLVLLLGRGDARTRTVRIAVVDSSGSLRETSADLGAATGLRLPAVAVAADGRRAYVVAAGAPLVEVDLEAMTTSARTLRGGRSVPAGGSSYSRQVVVLPDGELAVTGNDGRKEKGLEVTRPAGLELIDTSTWRVRLVDPDASGVSVSGETLLASSFRIDRVVENGKPVQKVSGIGIRAYRADGSRLWRRYGGQAVSATAFRQIALVHRHALGGAFVIDLTQGRQLRTLPPRQNFWLLPDIPTARPIRAPAGVTERDALELNEEAGGFEATVRDDVTRVVASLVDGSERELPIVDGAVSYAPAAPDEAAQTVQAFAGEELLTSITVPVTCGGTAGPCSATTRQENGVIAILRSRNGTRLTVVDPSTLEPIAGRSVAIDGHTSAHALSADGSRAAVGGYETATVRLFDTSNLAQAVQVALAPGNAGVRALEWLAPNRLVAVVQSYKRADRRAVSGRELVVLDAESGKVVRRTKLPIARAIVDVQASGGRLVAVLRSSDHRGTGITVLVADAAGRVRSREIRLRPTEGVLPETRLTLERGGKRAFLLAWQAGGGGPQPLRVIDLDRLTVSQRRVTLAEGVYHPPSGFMARAESFGEHGILISGAFVPLFRDGKHVPAAGIFLLDTRTFRIRQVDARANAFVVAGDRAYTFGSTALRAPAAPRGIGLAAYDTTGKRLYHAFGTRTFTQLLLVDGVGHLHRHDRGQGVAFDPESGRSFGPRPTPEQEIAILEPADYAGARPAAWPGAKRAGRRPQLRVVATRSATAAAKFHRSRHVAGSSPITPTSCFSSARWTGRPSTACR